MFHVVLITGISGSGKSVAIRQLEDQNYLCCDNLPVKFLHDFIANAQAESLEKVAVAIDVRSPGDLAKLPEVIASLRAHGIPLQVIFLEASDHTLIQRYSESRRRHPLAYRLKLKNDLAPSLEECIAHERELLAALRDHEHVIDTSDLTPMQLRTWIKDLVIPDNNNVLLTFESFAFKKGVPSDADLVFDVRCLPNPHYEKDLRPLTGCDEPVATWLSRYDSVSEIINDITAYIQKWLPHYMQDTRSYFTVAIGCTGGQHRSVYVAEELAKRFSSHRPIRVRHRSQVPTNST